MKIARLLCAVLLAASLPAFAEDAGDGKRFWFIFLETGKPTPPDKEAVMKMQRGHIANFERLFAEKKLFGAGPLADPSKLKRGIVVVRAASREELIGYFQPDDYVREGYMTVNAQAATAHKALNTQEIDTKSIEELRIIQIARPGEAKNAKASAAFLQSLLDKGVVGAWYTLDSGPMAEILFARTTDDAAIRSAFAAHPQVAADPASLAVWSQWLGKGVVK